MTTKSFEGYILAGGKSSRMKRDKAFLEIDGETFLRKAANSLAPNCSKVFAVINTLQTRFSHKFPANLGFVFDVYENRGALGGIHAALKNCQTEFAIILAVDLPFVTNDAIKNLCAIAENSKDFSVIVPRQNDGRLQPLCAVYRVENCLAKLEKILEKNVDASVRNFLQTVKTKFIEQRILSENEKLFWNINLPEDYANSKMQNL